ncbi:TRAP transporter substrate-binding protein [Hoeflea sp. YIM 152468]|uniref:TRAP transporter substrate-binding protein n=1 Tax=Hoeflea sp. YIM 152468 TaxID=3031759 RepID=UPI0023DA3E27|nr:TRAP transporter substrate-binding protein [Hoeflea sp. YIM 152468]MDF1609593.1 TRAP transporter substrate-binding protein [Hoeflea sp. YIM 152468]
MKYNFALTVAAGMLAATLSTAAQSAEWDMPTPYPDATFHTVNINQFAEDIKTATDGGLTITVHSAGSLIKHGEIKNAVRGGQVQIGEFFLSLLTNEDAAYGLDSQPFLATSYDEAARLWEAQKPVITELLARQKLVPLYAVPWPPQGLYTNTEIKTVDDLKGLKFRSYNAALEKFASLAGAAPTQVEVPDIPQAFSTGQVEAMITSPSTGANGKAWDYVSHYTPINAWVPKNIVVVNKAAFDGLDEATRAAVLEAAAAAEQRGLEMSMKETDAQTAVLKENGMTVVEPSAELLEGLMKIGGQMQAEWQQSASEQAKAIVADYAN